MSWALRAALLIMAAFAGKTSMDAETGSYLLLLFAIVPSAHYHHQNPAH